MQKKILIIAHRGASGSTKENTIEAFQEALKLRANMVEFDVNITKDKKFIIFHDNTLKRITNVEGRLSDFTLKQIKKIDEKIPTLKECLGFFKNKKVKLNIEIKPRLLGFEEEFYNIIKNYKKQILVSSLNLKILVRLRKIDPKLKLGVFFMKPPLKPISFAKKINAFSIHPPKRSMKKKLLVEAHKNNLKTYVWTVDRKKHMKKFIKYGVDGIVTNYPERLKGVLNEMYKGSS